MAISTEGKLGLAISLLALGGGGAVWVAPDHTELGWIMIGVAAAGAIALAVYHFEAALARSWRRGQLRMLALASGVAIAGSAAVYFWPRSATSEGSAYLYIRAEKVHDIANDQKDLVYTITNTGKSLIIIREVGIVQINATDFSWDSNRLENLCISPNAFNILMTIGMPIPKKPSDKTLHLTDPNPIVRTPDEPTKPEADITQELIDSINTIDTARYTPTDIHVDGCNFSGGQIFVKSGDTSVATARFQTDPVDSSRRNVVLACPYLLYLRSGSFPFDVLCKGFMLANTMINGRWSGRLGSAPERVYNIIEEKGSGRPKCEKP
jgi:hypothetical protein